MSVIFPSSFSFIGQQISTPSLGLGIIQLPNRNFFQSIGDFFAERSGKQRVSYMVLTTNEIQVLHFQGTDCIGSSNIAKDSIESITFGDGSTSDRLVSFTEINVEACISLNKKGIKKFKSHYFKLMPALLGLNTSQINNIADITWAKASKTTSVDTLKSWNEAIQVAKKAELEAIKQAELEAEAIKQAELEAEATKQAELEAKDVL